MTCLSVSSNATRDNTTAGLARPEQKSRPALPSPRTGGAFVYSSTLVTGNHRLPLFATAGPPLFPRVRQILSANRFVTVRCSSRLRRSSTHFLTALITWSSTRRCQNQTNKLSYPHTKHPHTFNRSIESFWCWFPPPDNA